MTDLERRLGDALRGLPESSEEARRRAEGAALDALPPPEARRRPRWLVAAVGAAVAAVGVGTALAATDRLEVRIGREAADVRPAAAPTPPKGQVRVPSGSRGLALVAGGRLWLGTRSGLGVQGLAVSAAELSPNASYVAVGIGRSLVAIAPGGRRAWSHPTPGPVVAAAWAPNPIVVAYVVRRGERYELRVIEGDGSDDQLVDTDVAPTRPSWRADTHALAYVANGTARVAEYPSLATSTRAAPSADVGAVAFAPAGDRLAVATAGPGALVTIREGERAGPWVHLADGRASLSALGWSSTSELVVAGGGPGAGMVDRLWSLTSRGVVLSAKASAAAYGPPVAALGRLDDSGRLAVAVRVADELQVWDVPALRAGRDRELRPSRVLLRVPASDGVEALSVR